MAGTAYGDLQTAILDAQLSNALVVEDDKKWSEKEQIESTDIYIHPDTAHELELYQYGPAYVLGKKQKKLALCVRYSHSVPEKSIFMSEDTKNNLSVRIHDKVKLYQVDISQLPKLLEIHFFPIADSDDEVGSNPFDEYITPFFNRNHLFITEGSIFKIQGETRSLKWKIVKLLGNIDGESKEVKHGIVQDDTSTVIDGRIPRDDLSKESKLVGYDDIGGCRRQLAQIRELIELPLKRPELFEMIGIKPPKGVLLHGPPGTGKTLIAKAIANETGAYFHIINGPEIMSKVAGESESNLRKAFEEAEHNAPSIIFMDEIDSIAPNRDKSQGEVEKRIVSQLLTLMDGMKSTSNVMVLAATNRPNSIDPALRRFGRFDREIEIGVPDDDGRWDVLRIHTRNMHIDEKTVDLEKIAKDLHGFTGSDIASLCSEAALQQIREKLPQIDLDRETIDPSLLHSLKVNNDNFKYAIANTDPSSLREKAIETPNVKWSDIGGLKGVIRELKETVQYPVNYPEMFLKFGQNPSKGVLLYGPPGCGKTLLAKAVATECNANFISVKGPELLTMWVGESEKNVRELFDKARGSAPCVLFFDEIDSIGSARSSNSKSSGVIEGVLNQMLVEMDGMNQKKNVFIIGATNRPGNLDTALLRPGRLDQLVYIPLPDLESRMAILKTRLDKTPLDPTVNLSTLAEETSGFSGADLAEICQRSAKLAIRESIAAMEESGEGKEFKDGVHCLTTKHFEEALKTARKSVTKAEIDQFEAFAQSMKVKLQKYDENGEEALFD
ncbi:transitional endoplasmic reticulum ATPase [Enteropsectra breve]|nr:transitional endoplasmic reticulum ATPase [Enteropsectra breve]